MSSEVRRTLSCWSGLPASGRAGDRLGDSYEAGDDRAEPSAPEDVSTVTHARLWRVLRRRSLTEPGGERLDQRGERHLSRQEWVVISICASTAMRHA